MIGLERLGKDLNEKLNNNNYGLTFNVATDTASLVVPKREGNTLIAPINALLSSSGSEVSKLTGENELIYATQSCVLKVIMSLPDDEEDIIIDDGQGGEIIYGYKTRIKHLNSVLNSLFQGISTENITEGNNTYSVTSIYSMATSGSREMVSQLGDCYSIYCYITYFYVQNGINTRAMTFKLDGALIPFQLCTVYRTPTMDGNVYANTKNGATKNISSQSNFNVSFEFPAMVGKIFNSIKEYVVKGALNMAHFLRFNLNGTEENYLVTFGETSIVGETIKNANTRISLVETPDDYELISFPGHYKIYKATSDIESINIGDNQVFCFGSETFAISQDNNLTGANIKSGNYLVSTGELTHDNITIIKG